MEDVRNKEEWNFIEQKNIRTKKEEFNLESNKKTEYKKKIWTKV